MKRMIFIILAVGFVLSGCTSEVDTPELRLERAREVANLEITHGALDDALNLGADIAMAASADALDEELGRQATKDEQEQVHSIFRKALAEFITPEAWVEVSAKVYAQHLTPAELKDVTAFYNTSTGSKLLGLQAEITAKLGDAAEAIFIKNEKAFAEYVDKVLAETFPEIGQEKK